MAKIIIGLAGLIGCGKGTVADILKESYGAGYYRFSAIMGDILTRLSIEKSRENFIKISEGMRKTFGEDVYSYAIASDAAMAPEEIIVIDGIRRLEDMVALEPMPQFKLLAVSAPAATRFERVKKRGEKATEAGMTWEQFENEEKASTEVTIPAVLERAWKTIDNTGTREDLVASVHAIMSELGFSPKK